MARGSPLLSAHPLSMFLLIIAALIEQGVCGSNVSSSLRGMAATSACTSDTGGTCNVGSCSLWRGPTTCEGSFLSKRCMCKAGYCSQNGACRMSIGPLTATVASVTASHPAFPGLHGQISTALCISGGGSRSLSLAMGQLRALESLGFMKKIDAISAVSGGAWATSVYMFADMATDTLLGEPSSPATLTMDALKKAPPALGKTVVKASLLSLALSLKTKGVANAKLWQEIIAKTILAPFGLDDKERFMAASSESVTAILEKNPDLKAYSFVTPVAGRPKVFIMGGTLLAPGKESVKNNGVSFQMSPDFTGSPFYPDGKPLSYDTTKNIIVGGGLVETFAFGGVQPTLQSGGEQVSLPPPPLPFTLSDAVGISSAAFAAEFSKLSSTLSAVNPEVEYWPVTQADQTQASIKFQVGDGGDMENTGVLEALQRGARRILWFANTVDVLVKRASFDFCGVSSGGLLEPKGKVSTQVFNKFGYGTGLYAVNTIFSSADFAPLVCDLQKVVEAGKPAVVHKSLRLLPNTWWGIVGGYDIDLVLIYNEVSTAFQDELPLDTQAELAKGSSGDFANFPHYKTLGQNSYLKPIELTSQQVNLLAAQGEYAVLQNKNILEAVLDGSA